MGMTIHYSLKTESHDDLHVTHLIERLHQKALESAFE